MFLILYFANDIILALLMMAIISTIIMIPYYIFSELQNNYIDQLNLHDNRATVLSIFNMGNNILSICSFVFLSIITNVNGLNTFLIVGVFYLLIAICYKNVDLER